MTSTLYAIKRRTLQQRLDALTEEFQLISDQISLSIDPMIKLRLTRTMNSLDSEILKIEAELTLLEAMPPAEMNMSSPPILVAGPITPSVERELRQYQESTRETGTYRYRIQVLDGGQRVGVDIWRPDRSTITRPRGECQLAPIPEPILDLASRARRGTVKPDDLDRLGQALFDALLPRELASDLHNLIDQAGREGATVRLELDLDEAELPAVAALPWELLQAPQNSGRGTNVLGTHRNVALTRRRALWNEAQPIALKEPLRIQLVVSQPKEEGLGPVLYEEMAQAIERLGRELPELIAPPLEVLKNPRLYQLSDVIEHRRPHLLHIIGHGRMRKIRGLEFGELALVGGDGGADWRSDTEISELFQGFAPSLAFFQVCESGAVGSSQAFVSVASQVVQQNVPVVVAMQYPISNLAAIIFAEEFYRRLGLGEPVDTAVQRSRRHLRQREGLDPRDFASPVLFMRVEDGRLFVRLSAEEQARRRGTEQTSSHAATATSASSSMNPPMLPDVSQIKRSALRDAIVARFTSAELALLCEDIQEALVEAGHIEHVSIEIVGGSTLTSQAHNLIGWMERRGKLAYLVQAVRKHRPGAI